MAQTIVVSLIKEQVMAHTSAVIFLLASSLSSVLAVKSASSFAVVMQNMQFGIVFFSPVLPPSWMKA